MDTSSNWNYYEVLEVPANAEQDDIYRAYKDAKNTFSLTNSDIYKTFTRDEALSWLQAIEEAFSIVGHPQTRKIYDHEIFLATQKMQKSNFKPQQQTTDQDIEEFKQVDITEIPDGHGATSLGHYPIDKEMEESIVNQTVFDGLFLRKIRIYKKLDLQEFSKSTCIAVRHLYAIENNNFSVLPAPVFVRGYIIQYCRFLDLDEEKVIPSFMSLLTDG